MKKTLSVACAVMAPLLFSQSATAAFDYFKKSDDGFKRFSISGGWLHADPQGDTTPVVNKTAINEGYQSQGLSIYGLEEWSTPGTGLESDTVDTFGMLLTHYIDDHWGVEVKAGIPPTVDILGKGEVFANVTAKNKDVTLLERSVPITDLTQGNGVASTARAWLPAALVQYQFGKPGVNKFRPYVGVGVMYAYFDDIDLNKGIGQDLQVAAGRLQLIKENKPVDAIGDNILNNNDAQVRDMRVKVEADSAWAPILNIGATYDFDDNWFAVGSLSYAKLDSDTTITVKNKAGEELIEAKSNIDIDPYITYLGIGYRF